MLSLNFWVRRKKRNWGFVVSISTILIIQSDLDATRARKISQEKALKEARDQYVALGASESKRATLQALNKNLASLVAKRDTLFQKCEEELMVFTSEKINLKNVSSLLEKILSEKQSLVTNS